jgi:hypothetical protein
MWSVFWTAEQNFKPLGPNEQPSNANMASFMDTQIEVIDVARRTAIVTQRFSEVLLLVSGSNNYFYSVRQSSDDIWVVDVYRAEITGLGSSTH